MFLLATATAVSMPALASAAVITYDNNVSLNQNYSFSGVIAPGDDLQFRFTVLDDLFIPNFAVSASGNDAKADVEEIRFGLIQPVTGEFTLIEAVGDVASGLGFIEGMAFDAGDMFSVFFSDGIENDVAVTVSFGSEALSPVPLPAGGLLMVPFLLAGGIAAWRRRKLVPVVG